VSTYSLEGDRRRKVSATITINNATGLQAVSESKGKILVVDDDRLVLATLTFGLAQAGFEVIDADNGDDAILLAREHRPELALLDIRMEGLSGFDVAAYLREYLQIPFMFLSAFADEETVAKVKSLGAVAYLVKPLDIHQIVPSKPRLPTGPPPWCRRRRPMPCSRNGPSSRPSPWAC
jgi:CheY-like chemotaxis protein